MKSNWNLNELILAYGQTFLLVNFFEGVLTLPFIFELSYWYLMTVNRMLKFWYDSLQQLHCWLPTFLHVAFVLSEKRAGICEWREQELNGGVNNDKSSEVTLTSVSISQLLWSNTLSSWVKLDKGRVRCVICLCTEQLSVTSATWK